MEEAVIKEVTNEAVETTSMMFVLEEMSDSIAKSLDNIKSVISQQMTLVDIVKASEKAEMFTDFTSGIEEQINNFADQSSRLANQKAALDSVIEMCHNNAEVNDAVNKLIVGFNIQNA